MMLGTREVFEYFECTGCGTVQLVEIPANLADYYPNDYYSLRALDMPPAHGLRMLLKKLRADYLLTGRGIFGRVLAKKFGYWPKYDWLRAAGARRRDAILDIGCGSGETLLRLRDEGFTNLAGADPFIAGPLEYPGCGHSPVRVFKSAATELSGQYDLIMLDHSFEHVPNPAEVMAAVVRLLRPGGRAIIGIPVATWAWKHYRANWVELDAPRHLFIYTPGGMELMGKRFGLAITRTIFDSSAFQFFGSEMYRRDIPLTRLRADGSRYAPPAGDFFTESELAEFAIRADALNRAGEGGRACFIFSRE
jgi:SAM-dependent methyltransferase